MPFSSVLSAYRSADSVVLPSVRARDGSHDVTPNTLIEAMAMRLPVVSTTIGAIPEIVDHEIDGLLVPPNDARALAAALERLLREPALRRRLGEAARRKVEARFDMDRNVGERARLFAPDRRPLRLPRPEWSERSS
jgi:glycosyltransferase involved in cell wall biosynthesis